MNSHEFKQARRSLGLSMAQLAAILGVDDRTVRRWEAPEDTKGYRPPNPIAVRVLGWLASGELKLANPPAPRSELDDDE